MRWTRPVRHLPSLPTRPYLIDVKFGIIMDVEASRAIRQAEVGAAKTMIERTEERFNIKPQRLAADTAYGSGPNLNWLVKDKDIAPHIPVIDKSKREDGTFSREDFRFDKERNVYVCPADKTLKTTGSRCESTMGDASLPREHVRLSSAAAMYSRPNELPKAPFRTPSTASIYEEARDVARALAKTRAFEQSSRERKRVEMLFVHLKRILQLRARPETLRNWPPRCQFESSRWQPSLPKPSSARQTADTATANGRCPCRVTAVGGPETTSTPPHS